MDDLAIHDPNKLVRSLLDSSVVSLTFAALKTTHVHSKRKNYG